MINQKSLPMPNTSSNQELCELDFGQDFSHRLVHLDHRKYLWEKFWPSRLS
jgi:hypothetical protein